MRIYRAGGSPATFYTIQTPLGTAPVATGADILTFASSHFDITGDATTDTITFALKSSIFPTFTSGSIPFGNGTGLTQDNSNLFWDDANNTMGIQTNTPLHALHVVGETGVTINSVVTASVSGANESLNTSPTGSATLIAEFAAISGSTTAQNTSGSGYTANGQTIDYRVYQVKQGTNGTNYASQYFDSFSFTDGINDGMTGFSVVITFGTTNAETTHLLIEKQVNGGGYNDSVLITIDTSYEDSAFYGTATYSSWPTQYQISYTAPTAPSGLSGQEINVGMGNLTESGITYDFEVRSAGNVNGTYFCEQTGSAGNFTDANAANTFDLQVDWTPGTGDDQVIRISSNGGSTWDYQFVGGMSASFVWTNQGNDTAAETAWTNDISTASIQYAFKAYAINTAPSGQTVYTPSANTYYATVTTPNVNYIIKHTYTGFLSPGARVLADYNVGVTNGYDISNSTFIDPGYSSWASGTGLSPSTYAFANGTARYFKLVGTNGTIYSPTPLVVNATTSGSQYFSGSFSYPSGITTVKILLSSDGVTYTTSKTFTSPTTSFTYDAVDNTWSGNTTISPTASVPGTARIDRAQTVVSDVPHLSLVEITGSGTRYASIGFGAAASKSSSISAYVARISAEISTGYLSVGAGRLVGYTSSAMNTEQWRLGSSYDFNLNSGSSAHFTYWSATPGTALAYFYAAGDSSRGTLYLGQQTTSFGTNSKVVICPTAGGATALHFRRTSGFTGDNILIDSNGSFVAGWGQEGRMYLNSSSLSTTTWLKIGGSNSGSQIRLDQHGVSTASTNGDIWNDPTNKCINVYINGVKQYDTRALFSQTATVTVANTTTETTLISTGIGTVTLPTNFFVAGKTIRIKAWGYMSSTGNPTLTVKLKLGSTTVCTYTGTSGNPSNNSWQVDSVITCRTTGSSGTVFGQGLFEEVHGSGLVVGSDNTATTTINTTSSLAVNLTAQWGTANAGNTITITNFVLEVML